MAKPLKISFRPQIFQMSLFYESYLKWDLCYFFINTAREKLTILPQSCWIILRGIFRYWIKFKCRNLEKLWNNFNLIFTWCYCYVCDIFNNNCLNVWDNDSSIIPILTLGIAKYEYILYFMNVLREISLLPRSCGRLSLHWQA